MVTCLFCMACIAFLFYNLTFSRIYYVMQKYHRYEFKRTRSTMVAYYLLSISFITINTAMFYLIMTDSVFDQGSLSNLFTGVAELCQEDKVEAQLLMWSMFINFMLGLPGILQSLIVIKLKSSQDILQGVSKLDYLLKVSVFQKYKDKTLERDKMSITTGTMAVDRCSLTSTEINRESMQ